jgi:hypothetical protein
MQVNALKPRTEVLDAWKSGCRTTAKDVLNYVFMSICSLNDSPDITIITRKGVSAVVR